MLLEHRAALCAVACACVLWTPAAAAQDAGPSTPDPEPDPEPPAEPAEPAEPAPSLTAPRVIEAVDPTYPPEEIESGLHPAVRLHVTLDARGRLVEAHVDDSAGTHFDREALAAIRRWRFEPARRGDTPIPSRIRVELRFWPPGAVPSEPPPDFDLPPEPPTPGEDEHDHHHHRADEVLHWDEPSVREPVTVPDDEVAPDDEGTPEEELGVTAEVEGRPAPRSASETTIDRDILEAAPRRDAGDLLRTVPGLFAARAEGDAVGHRLMLRGFDAEHGQDIELTVEGVPINLPSHIHGQGYSDLSFLIPEVVSALRVTQGVYAPSQGDFAVAGSVDFSLAVDERRRGVSSQTSYGSFDTFRQLLMWAPEGEPAETFGAAAYRRTGGFGQGRASESGTAILSLRFGDRPWRGRVFAIAHGVRASLAGVLRRDDVDAGRVGFLDRYDDPSAQSQSALAVRVLVGATLEHRGEAGARTRATLWGGFDDFRLQANFTGYTQRSIVMPEWVGRGDLIEQRNRTVSVGLRGEHRTRVHRLSDWFYGFIELGLWSRVDAIEQQQNLLQTPQNETWDNRIDASITGADVGAWIDLDWHVTDHLRVRGGARGDALYYGVDDRLGNRIPPDRRETYIVGARRTAFGFAAGPRASVEVRPIEELALLVAYGEGYRSPQARQLVDAESAPFTRVRSGDLGFRLELGERRELELAATVFYTHLGDDIVFEPREGRLEPVGPSTRIGGVFHAQTRPFPWLTAAVHVTYVHATLDEPPPASAEDPTPAFEEGALLPFVAPWVVRADASARQSLFELDGHPFRGRIGIGFSFLSPRPLPYGRFADPVGLLDASVSIEWRWITIGVEAFNLLDNRWAASELLFVSNWRPTEPQSRIPARHVSAGPPLTILATLGLRL